MDARCTFCDRDVAGFLIRSAVTGAAVCDQCAADIAGEIRQLVAANKTSCELRYVWRATYDDGTVLEGWRDGAQQSVAAVDFSRVARFELLPALRVYPQLTVYRRNGECLRKFWQVTQNAGDGALASHREVVGFKPTPTSPEVFLLMDTTGELILSATDNVP